MPVGKKPCQSCQAPNWLGAKKCSGCGAAFVIKEKKPRAPKESAPVAGPADLLDFAAGLTVEGGLYLSWPEKFEHLLLTPEQATVVRNVLNAREVKALA